MEYNHYKEIEILIELFFLENRGEFLEKLHRARSSVKSEAMSQPILSTVDPNSSIHVGNWSLTCKKEGQLHIHNSDGQKVSLDIVFTNFLTP